MGGDEWETYDTERTYLHPDDIAIRTEVEIRSNAPLSHEMKQQSFIRNAIIGCFVVLAVIGFLIGKWFESH